ncbi:MAG: alpha-galactosidase [Clostridium fessum]
MHRRGWISDDTDAIERLRIQYGTSYGYPISSMGSHVSASPNHTASSSDTALDTCQYRVLRNFRL